MVFAGALATLAIVGTTTVMSIIDPNYTLRFTHGLVGDSGETVEISALLDFPAGSGPVQGWSFSICHDYTELQPVAAEMTGMLATIQGGNAPDIFLVDFYAGSPTVTGGVATAVLIDYYGTSPLPSGFDYELLSVTYALVGPAGTEAVLHYCDHVILAALCSPPPFPGYCSPTPTILVVGGQSIEPTKVPGTIGIGLSPPDFFIRGDLDGDGSVTFVDAVALLQYIFQGKGPPACPVAGDIDDDGVIDFTDPLVLLGYLFTDGPPPAWPNSYCGVDPDAEADGSECDDSGSYCEP